MSDVTQSDFPISRDQYLSFDGLTIKEKIRQRLNQTGVFSDQNFEGSNLSAFNDVFGMVFSLLFYTLNKSSNEGQFTEATIYENMNRVVKFLDYKPVGHQTANVNFALSAQNIPAAIYNIPRYSYLVVGGVKYSFANDFGFVKTTDTSLESIDLSSDTSLLYQGGYQEFPIYTAQGNDNELLYITVNDTTLIDNFHIDVYVKSVNGKWERWNKAQSLYLSNGTDKAYELRYNENKRYELKFGNDINGKRLSAGDQVAVYYLASDGASGEVGANVLAGKTLQLFNTVQFNQIISDLEIYNPFISQINAGGLIFANSCGSTYYSAPETVTDIRANAPGVFRSQYALTTANAYEGFIKSNFSNVVQAVKVKNNSDYLSGYVKYFYDLGLTQPHLESRALINHMRFSDACSFNNVYCFIVPKTVRNTLAYLNPSQKSLIISSIANEKTLTADIIPMDPVYLAFDFALSDSGTTTISDQPNTQLVITKANSSRRNNNSIVTDVNNAIQTYFSRSTNTLGKLISIADLTAQLLGIEGVKAISTRRPDLGVTVSGIRLVQWNPVYIDASFATVNGNLQLEDFQFPYAYSADLTSRIIIE